MDKHIIRVTDLSYDMEDDLVVQICGRSMSGERVTPKVYGTEPYMFIPREAEDPRKIDTIARKIKEVTETDEDGNLYESYDGIPLKKVVSRYPQELRDIRDHYEDKWESDIPYVRRCTADYNLSGYIEIPDAESIHVDQIRSVPESELEDEIVPRTHFIDIETKMPDEFYNEFAEDAPEEVTAITSFDNYDDEYTLFALDPDLSIDPTKIRGYIEENWEEGSNEKKEILDAIDDTYEAHLEDLADSMSTWENPDVFIKYVTDRLHGNAKIRIRGIHEDIIGEEEIDNFHVYVARLQDVVEERLTVDMHDAYDPDINIVFKRFGNEKNLLNGFTQYVSDKQPDVMTGWNYIGFDHEYLVNRMFGLQGVSPHRMSDIGSVGGRRTDTYIDGIPAVDMMKALCGKLTYGRWESQALDYVSSEIVGVGKVEGDDVAFNRNRTKYMAYNIVDVQLCVEMDKIRGVMQFWYLLAEVCAIPPYEVGATMKECEGFLFKHRESDEILPDTDPGEMDRISGGFVLPPHNGVEPWVGVYDLKSLYPSSIITANISKETMTYDKEEADVIVPDVPLNYEKVAGDSIHEEDIGWELGEGCCVGFNLDKQGILPKYLKLLFRNREEMKAARNDQKEGSNLYVMYNQQQRAFKVVMNSFFGVSDNPYFRLAENGLGAAITSVSRFVSWGGVQIIEDEGYTVLYGDTDSLMVSMVEAENTPDDFEDVDEVIPYMIELEESINNQLDFVADMIGLPEKHPHYGEEMHGNGRHLWVYEAEKLYRRFLQAGTKKRYAGNIVWKEGKMVDDTDTVGYETEKSDATVLTKTVQKTFIEMALDGADYEELTYYVQDMIEGLENDRYPLQEIGFPSSINKPLGEYPNRPVKRACNFSNEYLGHDWRSGDNPWLIYVDNTPPRMENTDVIAVEWTATDLPDGFTLNVNKHMTKSIRGPLKSVLGAFDFTWRELKTGRREQSFMGDNDDGVDDPSDLEGIFDSGPATKDPFQDID